MTDPAADLAVAAALVSSMSERPVPQDSIVMGEIALSGEVRPIAHAALRIKEAAKLGFESAWVPSGTEASSSLKLERYVNLRQLVDRIMGR